MTQQKFNSNSKDDKIKNKTTDIMKETVYEVWSFESNEWVEAGEYEYNHTEEKYRRIAQSGSFRQPNRPDLMSMAEKGITTAIRLVEEAGASEHLTNALINLGKARDYVYEHYRTNA